MPYMNKDQEEKVNVNALRYFADSALSYPWPECPQPDEPYNRSSGISSITIILF